MISVQDIQVGSRVRLVSGKIVEVLDNPRDGMWLVVRDIDGDQAAYMLHFSEVGSIED